MYIGSYLSCQERRTAGKCIGQGQGWHFAPDNASFIFGCAERGGGEGVPRSFVFLPLGVGTHFDVVVEKGNKLRVQRG